MMTDPVEILFYISVGVAVISLVTVAWVLVRGRGGHPLR
jgi:hypothetical protein